MQSVLRSGHCSRRTYDPHTGEKPTIRELDKHISDLSKLKVLLISLSLQCKQNKLRLIKAAEQRIIRHRELQKQHEVVFEEKLKQFTALPDCKEQVEVDPEDYDAFLKMFDDHPDIHKARCATMHDTAIHILSSKLRASLTEFQNIKAKCSELECKIAEIVRSSGTASRTQWFEAQSPP